MMDNMACNVCAVLPGLAFAREEFETPGSPNPFLVPSANPTLRHFAFARPPATCAATREAP
eukprot:5335628-Prorocentrum_lima.AAC.1